MTNSGTAQKSADAFRTISEVAESLKLPQHVLRFWETRFTQIKPLKRGGGRRFYRPEDVELLVAIRQLLYGDGYTIKGVQRILKEQGPRAVASLAREGGGRQRAAAGQAGLARAEPAPASRGAEPGDAPPRIEPVLRRPAEPPDEAEWDGEETNPDDHGSPSGIHAGPSGAQARPPLAGDPLASLRAVLAELAECRRILQAARG